MGGKGKGGKGRPPAYFNEMNSGLSSKFAHFYKRAAKDAPAGPVPMSRSAQAFLMCKLDPNSLPHQLDYRSIQLIILPLLREARTLDINAAMASEDKLLFMIRFAPHRLHEGDGSGVPILHNAAKLVDTDPLSALLELKADVNSRNKAGATPLMIAAGGNDRAVKVLIDAHADPNASGKAHTDGRGVATPLLVAAKARSAACIQLLLDAKANPDILYEATWGNRDGISVLHMAVQPGLRSMTIVQALIAAGADLNLRDEAGNGALHLVTSPVGPWVRTTINNSIDDQSLQILKVLVEAGADATVTNKNNMTPMSLIQMHFPVSEGGEGLYTDAEWNGEVEDSVRAMREMIRNHQPVPELHSD